MVWIRKGCEKIGESNGKSIFACEVNFELKKNGLRVGKFRNELFALKYLKKLNLTKEELKKYSIKQI